MGQAGAGGAGASCAARGGLAGAAAPGKKAGFVCKRGSRRASTNVATVGWLQRCTSSEQDRFAVGSLDRASVLGLLVSGAFILAFIIAAVQL